MILHGIHVWHLVFLTTLPALLISYVVLKMFFQRETQFMNNLLNVAKRLTNIHAQMIIIREMSSVRIMSQTISRQGL